MNLKKVTITILIILLSIILLLATFIFWSYLPFIHEQRAFKITHNTGKTIIENSEFNLRFVISDVCELDSQIVNNVVLKWIWGGDLRCLTSQVRITIVDEFDQLWNPPMNQNVEYNEEMIFDSFRVRIFQSYDGYMKTLIIKNITGEKVMYFYGSDFLIDEIFDSLKFQE